MPEIASPSTHSETENRPMNTAPLFAKETHEAHYKAILHLLAVGAELGIEYQIFRNGNRITIATSEWYC